MAQGVKAIVFDPKLPALESIYLYDRPSSLSIREKYSLGTLTAQHPLTSLDLHRMLEVTDTKSTISILPFTVNSLGTALHYAKEAHKAAEPYTLPFLLYRSGKSSRQGLHWLAATITINPLSNTISYQIDDSLPLTQVQKS